MYDPVVLSKLVIGLGAAALTVPLLRSSALLRLSNARFAQLGWTALAVSRLGLFALVFLIVGIEPQSDTRDYYDWTKSMMAGLELYTDIPSCYMPAFHWLLVGPLLLWDSARCVVLTAIVLDLIAFPIWVWVSRRLFDEQAVRAAAVLYLINPVALWTVAVVGSTQIYVAILLAATMMLLIKGRDVFSGVVFGASAVVVKFLTLLYAPMIALCARGTVRWFASFAILVLGVYGAFRLNGIDLLASGRIVAEETSSGNLPFMLSLAGVDVRQPGFKRGADVVGVTLLLLTYALTASKLRGTAPSPRRAIFLVTLIHMAFMLVSKKSHVHYLEICFFPIFLTLAGAGLSTRGLLFLSLFALVSSVEQSIWFRPNFMQMNDFHVLWDEALPEGFSYRLLGMFFVLEVVLLSFYFWCLKVSWRQATAREDEPQLRPEQAIAATAAG